MVSKKTLNTLLVSAVALAVVGGISAANAMEEGKEKCYGVVKAGHNDCANAAGSHSCAGHAEMDGAGGDWVALPAGTCDKLVGGSTAPMADDAEAVDDAAHGEAH